LVVATIANMLKRREKRLKAKVGRWEWRGTWKENKRRTRTKYCEHAC
jgi:hypothetical protein